MPADLSLISGVTPSITYSENASISPDPSSVSNWEESEQFTVRAYDGTTTVYTYSVERETNTYEGSLHFTTQQEVDAFVAQQIHVIEGSLIIGKENREEDEEGITDIAGLATLKQITYDLVINPGYTGNTLDVFENLRHAGSITVKDLPHVSTIEASNLQTIRYALSLAGDKVETLNFPNLESIGGGLYLYLPEMTSAGFNYLRSIGSDLYLPGATEHSLQTISFPLLETVQGSVTLKSYPALNAVQFPALTFAGALIIDELPVLCELNFPVLKEIKGTLDYNSCVLLEKLTFPQLERCNGNFNFRPATNPMLETLDFSSLKIVGGLMTIYPAYYPSLKKLVFPLLEETGNHLSIAIGAHTAYSALESIAMPKLTTIHGNLSITADYAPSQMLTKLDFPSLLYVQNINITYLQALTSFDSFAKLIREGELSSWSITNCGVNPTYEEMVELYGKE
ncbi:MAG: DUF5018 domain-containing protein [Tannerellaceae bacterium]|nr:DUF5018 domain-containing protein [Tannerellaceae bacterium]